MNEATIKEALGKVVDPALGRDIVAYRIVRTVEVSGDDEVRPTHLPPGNPNLPRPGAL